MAGVVLASTLAGAVGGTVPAQGAVGPCRSDPVVLLSSLKALGLSALINDSSSDLKSVNYTVHLPKGVAPVLVVPTDGLVGQVEHFSYANDEPSGTYAATVTANTGVRVTVTASALEVLFGSVLASGGASGVSNQPISFVL